MPTCPACENVVEKLLKHHWFELPDMERHEERICRDCNNVLQPNKFFKGEECLAHVLPCWDEQVTFIKRNSSFFIDSILYRTYDIELMI